MSKSHKEHFLECLRVSRFKIPDTWDEVYDIFDAMCGFNETELQAQNTKYREALENIVKHREDEKEARTFLFPDPNQIAQEALGKINKEKHE